MCPCVLETLQITYTQLDKILPIGDWNYLIGDILPNWSFCSVSSYINHIGVCRTAPATPGLLNMLLTVPLTVVQFQLDYGTSQRGKIL